MRVVVTGSRDWDDWDAIWREMRRLNTSVLETTTILHGAARGADSMADYVARQLGYSVLKFPADWDKHGKAAGAIRNGEMLDNGGVDLVLAFHKNNSRGTANCIEQAEKRGIKVKVVEG